MTLEVDIFVPSRLEYTNRSGYMQPPVWIEYLEDP